MSRSDQGFQIPRRGVGALLMAVLVLLGSCSFRRQPPRVGMETDRTDILYGQTVAPVLPAPATPAEEPEPAPDNSLTRSVFTPSLVSQTTAVCPSAPENSAVAHESGTEVNSQTPSGQFRWVASGTYDVSGSKIPIVPTQLRYFRPPQTFTDPAPKPPGSPPSTDFTYQTIEPRTGAAGLWMFTWQVKSNASVSQDPEGGLTLKRIDIVDSARNVQGTYFSPVGVGLLMVPLSIRPGGTWNSASVGSGRVLEVSGQVLSREVIDACGTLIQGWHVHATLSDGTARATLDYLVATQFGGQIISLKIEGSYLGTSYQSAFFHTGQLQPDPLPEGFK